MTTYTELRFMPHIMLRFWHSFDSGCILRQPVKCYPNPTLVTRLHHAKLTTLAWPSIEQKPVMQS